MRKSNRKSGGKAMKKIIVALLAVTAMVVAGGNLANAATKLLPKGSEVSATVSSSGIATIVVTGVPDFEGIEYYAYEGIENIKQGEGVDIYQKGRRFQVVFGGGFYTLLTPDMRDYPPEFFGPGVGLDCSNDRGCAFIITGKRSK
ncbi:MAG: hypothetical protein GX765_04025 [Candidatus Moranbacteria bacterium]|nr:hypothetical protein [Candidatus Moranbacteria bacterium]